MNLRQEFELVKGGGKPPHSKSAEGVEDFAGGVGAGDAMGLGRETIDGMREVGQGRRAKGLGGLSFR